MGDRDPASQLVARVFAAIDTPMHPKDNHGFLRGLSPANRLGSAEEVAEAVLYLESASFVSGEILHVDGGAHAGKWS